MQDEEETAVKSLLDSKQNLNGADVFSLNIENFDGSTLLAHLVLGGATYLIIGDEMTVKEALGADKLPLYTRI